MQKLEGKTNINSLAFVEEEEKRKNGEVSLIISLVFSCSTLRTVSI